MSATKERMQQQMRFVKTKFHKTQDKSTKYELINSCMPAILSHEYNDLLIFPSYYCLLAAVDGVAPTAGREERERITHLSTCPA